MNDKYVKEIAKELKLIRIELQKSNRTLELTPNSSDEAIAKALEPFAGEQVTIK